LHERGRHSSPGNDWSSRTSTVRAVMNAPVRPPPGLYGDELAASFGADAPAPFVVTRSMPHAEFAVTELRVDDPVGRISDPLPCDDAYLISHELRAYRGMEYWENGRHLTTYDLRAGETTITDLRREPRVKFEVPVHCMLWLVPRAALDVLADDANVPRIGGLPHAPGVGFADETIRHLNLAAIAALQRPGQVSRLFVDHLILAFAAHVAQTYGGMQTEPRLVKGGLAPWQERRAKEMLLADLAGATPLAEIATACGLSPGHFARAFRRSTGLAPHAWLLKARVEYAMTLLRQADSSLSEIALSCGFADHSHFSRVFTRQTGQSPRDWRRLAVR
jgi:AraC family transcriptional regulator